MSNSCGLGMLAERYFADDPNTCLLKLRQLGRTARAKHGLERRPLSIARGEPVRSPSPSPGPAHPPAGDLSALRRSSPQPGTPPITPWLGTIEPPWPFSRCPGSSASGSIAHSRIPSFVPGPLSLRDRLRTKARISSAELESLQAALSDYQAAARGESRTA